MNLSICWTGKTNPDYLKLGMDEYIKRIRHFTKLEIKEFKETKGMQNSKQIITAEEKELFFHLAKYKYYLVLLDEKGTSFNSIEFAKWIDHKLNVANTNLCFIVGGAYGFSQEFKAQANELISFSEMTLSHQLIRLVFMEQLYRAFTIINHLPYHHE